MLKKLTLNTELAQAVRIAKEWANAERKEFEAAARLVEAGIRVVEAAKADPKGWNNQLEHIGMTSRSDAKAGAYNSAAKLILGVDAPRSSINRYGYAMAYVADLIRTKQIKPSEAQEAVIQNGGMTGCALSFRLPEQKKSFRSQYQQWLCQIDESRMGYIQNPEIQIQSEALALVRKKGNRLEVLLINDDPKQVQKKALTIRPVELE